MRVNIDVEDACVDVDEEGHDDVNTCVRMYNINITTVPKQVGFFEFFCNLCDVNFKLFE